MRRVFSLLTMLVLGAVAPAPAAPCEDMSPPDSAAAELKRLDPGDTDTSVPKGLKRYKGEVTKVIRRPRRSGANAMIDVLLRCGREEVLVRLAPLDFLEQKRFLVVEGDVLTLRAYPMTTVDGKLLVATEVVKSGVTLRLRNSPGRPAWKK
jgi:hypothetical protein